MAARARRASLIKAMATQRTEESMWGVPESPEFSAVQRLLHEFQSRESDEQKWLLNYKRITEGSSDPLIRFLLNLIVADEERHYELIDRMVSSLKDDLASTRQERSGPQNSVREKKSRELLPMVDRFINMERGGIRDYKRLHKVSQGFRHDLFGLLCKTMIHDSLKHIAILEFLRTKLQRPKRSMRKRKKRANQS